MSRFAIQWRLREAVQPLSPAGLRPCGAYAAPNRNRGQGSVDSILGQGRLNSRKGKLPLVDQMDNQPAGFGARSSPSGSEVVMAKSRRTVLITIVTVLALGALGLAQAADTGTLIVKT